MKRWARGFLFVSACALPACDSTPADATTGDAPAATSKPKAAKPKAPVPKRERPPLAIEVGADAATVFGDTLSEEEIAQRDSWPDERSAQLRGTRFSVATVPAPPGFDGSKAKVKDWQGLRKHHAALRAAATGNTDPNAKTTEAQVNAYLDMMSAGAEHRTLTLFVDMQVAKRLAVANDAPNLGRAFLNFEKVYGGFIAKHHIPDNVEEAGFYHPQTLENALVTYQYMQRMMGHGASLELSLAYLDDRADLLSTQRLLELEKLDADMLEPIAKAEASELEGRARLHWTAGETRYYLLEGKVRKTISIGPEGLKVLSAGEARAALSAHVQSLITADKKKRKRSMATMHYGDEFDVILDNEVITVDATEAKRVSVDKPASASHPLSLALAKRSKLVFFDHPGLQLAPDLRKQGVELVERFTKAYPKVSFEVPEPPAPPEPPAEAPPATGEKAPPGTPSGTPPKAPAKPAN